MFDEKDFLDKPQREVFEEILKNNEMPEYTKDVVKPFPKDCVKISEEIEDYDVDLQKIVGTFHKKYQNKTWYDLLMTNVVRGSEDSLISSIGLPLKSLLLLENDSGNEALRYAHIIDTDEFYIVEGNHRTMVYRFYKALVNQNSTIKGKCTQYKRKEGFLNAILSIFK